MPMPIVVTVHDGRVGRADGDGSGLSPPPGTRGEVLAVFESHRPLNIGEDLELPEGSSGRVKQTIERSGTDGVKQQVTVVDPHPEFRQLEGAGARVGAPCGEPLGVVAPAGRAVEPGAREDDHTPVLPMPGVRRGVNAPNWRRGRLPDSGRGI